MKMNSVQSSDKDVYTRIAQAKAKRERGEKLTQREWVLIAYSSQACHCTRTR